ncbi:MAG: lytic transglycosylase, partial [Neisseriaceae bacterium]
MADSFFSWPFSGNKSTPAEQADEQPEAQQETTIADPVPEQSERIGQPAPNWTPTPAPLSYDSLWDRMRDNFAIPNLDSALVREWEQYYAARPEQLYRISERGKRYMYHVVDELEKRSMPLDLALLPMIESAYNPRAYSPAHASGIWQFIPSTGKNYGLEQTWWYDGRRDVLAATEAALDYLNYLYGLFGDW